jgi:hypothetical protein
MENQYLHFAFVDLGYDLQISFKTGKKLPNNIVKIKFNGS